MNLNNISKYISLILRHKPETINIKLDKHGYAEVSELVKGIKKKYPEFTASDLDVIVETDDKQGYKYSTDGTKIRASQGHSIPVDLELVEQEPPQLLYHGTSNKYFDSIHEQGLLPQNRQYVHLSNNTWTAYKVGQRHGGKLVIYVVNAQLMYKHGYKFYQSENGVWLTDHVPSKYIEPHYIANLEDLNSLNSICSSIFRNS